MENTNNIINNKEDERKNNVQRHVEELQEHFMKELKIMKYINKNKEKTLKEYIKMIKKELLLELKQIKDVIKSLNNLKDYMN